MGRAASKKKICWNCEGDVPRESVNCPYCAVYLHPEEDELSIDHDDDDEDLTPPYQINTSLEETETLNSFPGSKESIKTKPSELGAGRFTIAFSGWKSVVIPLTSLLFGTLFLLFSFLLFVFSQNGVLTLQWNSDLWIIYGIIAFPLLFIGWKTLQAIQD